MLLRKFILLFSILFIIGFNLHSQNKYGMPLLDNYHPVVYKGYSQNWSISSNSVGLLFFANGDGILIYDGHSWNKILLPNNSTPSALYCDKNDVIWVGAQSEIGVLIPDIVEGYRYYSLSSLINEKDKDFGFILQILESSDGIYFRANAHLLRFSKGKVFVKDIRRQSAMFIHEKHPLFYNRDEGFSIISGNRFLAVRSQYSENMILRSVLPYAKDTLLLVDPVHGLYLAEINMTNILNSSINVFPINAPVNHYLITNEAYDAMRLQNGNYAFSTVRNGTVVTDKEFNILYTLNKGSGVMNETHNALYEDSQNNLWIALDHGISKINLSSSLTHYNDRSGITGSVLDIKRFASRLFVATWQGVFYENNANQNLEKLPFSMIPEILSVSWSFEEINIKGKNYLLLATSDGLKLIDSLLNVTELLEGNYTFIKVDQENNRIFAGSPSKVELIVLQSGIYKPKVISIPQIEGRITGMVLTDANNLAIGTALNGVYIVHATILNDVNDVGFELFHLLPGKDLPKSDFYNVYRCDKHVLIISKTGILKLNRNENAYSADVFDPAFVEFFQNYQFINIIRHDINGNFWFQVNSKQSGEKKLLYAERKKGKFKFISKPFKTFPNLEFYNIYPEKDSVVWFASDDGVFRYQYGDKSQLDKNESFPTLIQKVTIANSKIYSGIFSMKVLEKILNGTDEFIPKITNSDQSIRFDFSASYYFNEEQVMFSHFLKGFDETWSPFSKETYKEYTSLPSGDYIFRVKAVNPYGVEGEIASFRFNVPTLWYFRWWAWISYGLIIIALLFFVISMSNRRLMKAKLRLEKIIHRRTLEINNQKKAIELEKEKSDALLLNILPVRIAEELKSRGYCQTEFYQSTTVLFTDFSNFTSISENADPEHLVLMLHTFFARFDEICSRNKLEKIKTIGDSHMSVGGIPVRNRTHPIDSILAAMEMLEFIKFMHAKDKENEIWQLRIGINSGELTSGVVGKKKFAFDVWGDTVNTASRFQAAGECGEINISSSTAEAVKDFFEMTYRGKLPIKHKGEVDMYYITSIKKELSIEEKGEKANFAFWKKYNDLLDMNFLNF